MLKSLTVNVRLNLNIDLSADVSPEGRALTLASLSAALLTWAWPS